MKQKMYIIDLLAEEGHVNFVNRITEILSTNFQITFVSSKSYCKKCNFQQTIGLDDFFFIYSGRFDFVIKQGIIIRKIQKLIDPKVPVIITGFENISYAIWWKRKSPNYAFLHNNVDKRGISSTLLRRINNNTSFFVFEPYIKKYLTNKLSNRVHLVPHPMSFETKKALDNSKRYAFAINVNTASLQFRKLAHFCKEKEISLFVKTKEKAVESSELVIKDFYDDYYDKLVESDFIALEVEYDYRISGVFYEAMIFNKKVLFMGEEGVFQEEMYKKYKANVALRNPQKLDELIPDNSQFLLDHNDNNILRSITNAIFKT